MPALDHASWLVDAWSERGLQRVDELLPTVAISRGEGRSLLLEEDPADLDDLSFEGRDGRPTTLAEHVDESRTEGLIVLHRGRVAYERMRNGMTPDTHHLIASVTKSLTVDALGVQVERGLLARDDLAVDVDPRLAGAGFEGATVGQVIDMTAGIAFSEDMEEASDLLGDAPVGVFMRQAGALPLAGDAPIGVRALLPAYGAEYAHGERFEYRTPLTMAASGLIEGATGRAYADVMADDVWSRIGAEHDLLMTVDVVGEPFAGGGGQATLRDLARYGQMHLDRGRVGDTQVLPAAWVDDVATGDAEAERAFRASVGMDDESKATWRLYRGAWWVTEPGVAYEALGLLGQVLRINRRAGTVIVRLSAQPLEGRHEIAAETYRAHAAIERALAG